MNTPYSTQCSSLEPCAALRRSLLEHLAKIVLVFCSFIGIASASFAATQTWSVDGSGGSGTWDYSDSNWYGSSVWAPWGNAVFGGSTGGTVTLGESVSANKITFQAPTTGNYTLAGSGTNLLTIQGGGMAVDGGVVNVSAPIALSAGQTWSVATGAGLNFSGAATGTTGVLTLSGSGAINFSGYSNTPILQINATNLVVSGTMVGNDFVDMGWNAPAKITVNGGLIANTGGRGLNVGDVSGAQGVVNLVSGTIAYTGTNIGYLAIGKFSGARGVLNVSGGLVDPKGEILTSDQANTFGALNVSGGVVNATSFRIGSSAGGTLKQTGGVINTTSWTSLGRNIGGLGVGAITGGTFNSPNTGFIVSEQGDGILTMAGSGNLNLGTNNLNITIGAGTTSNFGIVNLNGGTVSAGSVVRAATGTATLNLNGGVLRATKTNASFLTGLTNTYVNSGGANFDSNGFDITVAQSLQAPTGNGVGSIDIPNGGSGYISAPIVTISGGGGTGATAIADIDANGTVTGLTITNPGVGYTSEPTITINGPVGTGFITGTVSLVSNTSGGLTKNGLGTLTLSGSNTFSGLTRVATGTLALNHAYAIQNSTLDMNAADSGAVTFPLATTHVLGGLSGSRNLDLGTRTVQIGNNNASTTFSGGVSNGALTKIGTGTLTLSGSNGFAGGMVVNNGGVNLASGGSIATGNSLTVADGTNNALLTLNGGSITRTSAFIGGIGATSTGAGAVVVNSGVFSSTAEIWLGSTGTAQGYGAMTINSGTVSSASWFALGRGNTNGPTSSTRGLLTVNGGTLNVGGGGSFSIGAFQLDRKATSVVSVTGGSVNVTNDVYVGENLSGILDISGGSLSTGTAKRVGLVANAGNTTGKGILNLRGGTLTTGGVYAGNVTGTSIFNFNGGTLRASQDSASYMTGLTGAYLHVGGGTIDTNGKAITIAQPLLAASGTGLSTIGVSGGSGYVGAPIVDISGGGGTGATALASIDANGNLTAVTVTNPGTGYTSTPTITLVGGGGSGATIGSITTAVNTSGGLVKTGEGTLTLSGSSNFTGNITVSSGTLIAANSGNNTGATGALGNVTVARTITVNNGAALGFTAPNVTGDATVTPAASFVVNSGGVLNSATNQYNSLGPVTLNGGTINTLGGFNQFFGGFGLLSTITVLPNANTATLASPSGSNSYYTLAQSGANVFDVADGAASVDLAITGSMRAGSGLTKTGPGVMAINTNITHGGATTVNAGKLIVSASLTGNSSVSVAGGAELVVNGFLNTGATATINGTLKGSGTLGPVVVNNGGAVAPGNGVGSLNVASLSGTTGATLAIELGKTTAGIAPVAGTDYSQIVASSVTLDNITLSLSTTGANNIENGDLFFLVINDSLTQSGTFTGLAQDSIVNFNGRQFQISYLANWTGDYATSGMSDGNDVALLAVPEPSSWIMIISGFGMLFGIQRLRKNRVGTR